MESEETVTLGSFSLIKISIKTNYKPLENLRLTKDIPTILHLRQSTNYVFSDTAFDKTAPLTNVGIVLNDLQYSSYNCPENCQLCSADMYPNGVCFSCKAVL